MARTDRRKGRRTPDNRCAPDAIYGSIPEFMFWRNIPAKKPCKPMSIARYQLDAIDAEYIPGLDRNSSMICGDPIGDRMERRNKATNRNRMRLRRRCRERKRLQCKEVVNRLDTIVKSSHATTPSDQAMEEDEKSTEITDQERRQSVHKLTFPTVSAKQICSQRQRVQRQVMSQKLRSAAAGACVTALDSRIAPSTSSEKLKQSPSLEKLVSGMRSSPRTERLNDVKKSSDLQKRPSTPDQATEEDEKSSANVFSKICEPKRHHGGGKSMGDNETSDQTIVYDVRHTALSYKEAFRLLSAPEDGKLSVRPPFRPPSGHIYMYPARYAKDNIADGYNWTRNDGIHRYPENSPIVAKRMKRIITDDKPIRGDTRFKLHIYKLTQEEPSPMLVQYLGDEKIFKPRPQGNERKNLAKEYFATAPSVREQVKSIRDQPAELVYETLKSKSSARMHPAFCPRDLKQVQNLQCASRRDNRLSHDPLYEVYLLGFEFPHFIREYRTSFEFENNIIFLTSPTLLEKANKLLAPPPNVNNKLMEFYYDTTFGIGDYFVSVLSYRHFMLQGEPVIPCAFFIHQRRFEDDHLAFLSLVKDSCPNLAKQPFAFITDREFRDVSSIFKEARHFFCWKHLRDDIRWWLIRHPGSAFQQKDRSRSYINDIDCLLHSSTIEEYDQLCDGFKTQWADAFITYFDKHLDQDLRQKLCLFAVCDSGLVVEDRWLGITSNAAESFNAVLKRAVKNSKFEHQNFYGKVKSTMAECVLICYNLTKHFTYEIETGMCGIGKTPIKPNLIRYKEDLLDLGNPDPPIPLDQIFAFVKNQIDSLEFPSPAETVANKGGRQQMNATSSGFLDDSTEAHANKGNQSVIFDVMKEKKDLDVRPEQQARAKELCQRGKVTVVAQRGVFVVENMEGRKYCR